MNRELEVRVLDAWQAGSCQACDQKEGKVVEMIARRWVARLCQDCLKHAAKEAARLFR